MSAKNASGSSDKITLCFGNQWPTDAFFENVEEAVEAVLKGEPEADPGAIRALVLFEWLGYSHPAGIA